MGLVRGVMAALCAMVGLTAAAAAEQEVSSFAIAQDVFRAGQTVTLDEAGRADAFLAGERVTLDADVTGTAHVAGRWAVLSGAIGQNLYALGQRLTLSGPVAGNATLLGQELRITAPVGGNLRATASDLRLTGDVTGYAMLAGERVEIDSAIAGDLALTAREVDFGTGARVEGTLILYENQPGSLTIPATVAPSDRVERRPADAWGDDHRRPMMSWRGVLSGFLAGVLLIAAIAAGIALLAPEALAAMRRRILDRPGRSLGLGFVALSALAGAGLVVALTGIGILLTPAFFLLAALAGLFGYVIGAYALGVALLGAAGRPLPQGIGDRALAAGVGALVAGLVALIPFFGWLFVLALVLVGLGALTIRLLPEHMTGVPRY
ncbi:ABC transporter permease family protein [Pseudodonghicola flavimaris]|uniref:DUF8173 domain-containing protein n=1 Tax=Pseudodonghicola flavimaris TaxID=3050036 RepID=A0ABT7EYP3_9RHOB|nr:hypothetical protein [Pseudodonghicola flavimaris]MDK3017449.1 hypothetical protein [Pseudodonghicola flavimaris]